MSVSWVGLARPAEVACLPEIERRAARLFSSDDLPAPLAARTTPVEVYAEAQRAGRLFVARVLPDRVVGFVHLREIDGAAHLEEVDVDPDFMRLGIGRALVEAALEWAIEAGQPAITLSTFRDVPWNAPFYASMGFTSLASAAITPGLAALREAEQALGLDIDRRVLMVRRLESASTGGSDGT